MSPLVTQALENEVWIDLTEPALGAYVRRCITDVRGSNSR
jgi:hypothetical protein